MKLNCWEYKKCGREVGGAKEGELGVCSATNEDKLDGIHTGKNAGRCCWVVAGTLCDGEFQGMFTDKEKSCIECDFYKRVRFEEGYNMIYSSQLLEIIDE